MIGRQVQLSLQRMLCAITIFLVVSVPVTCAQVRQVLREANARSSPATSSERIREQLRGGLTPRREETNIEERLHSHRTIGDFIKQRWYIAIFFVIALLILLFLRRLIWGPPPRPKTTGKMATLDEQLSVYGVTWGKGGFILGRQIEPPLSSGESLKHKAKALIGGKIKTAPRMKGEDEKILRIPLESRTMHTLIEAGSGAGKTSSMIKPQVMEDAYSGLWNVFLVDRRSPEMMQDTGGAWEAAGQRVIYFDPWDTGLTWGMEPVFGASPDLIRAMVEAHVQVSFDPGDVTKIYREQERAMLETLFLCAQEWGKRDRRLATLPALAELIALGFETTKCAIENARPDLNRRLVDQWKLSDAEQGKMFRSIFSRMKTYLIPEVAAAFSRADFTIDDIVVPFEKGDDRGLRTLLIVGASQAKGEASEWIASFITQLVMHAVYERGLKMKMVGARWPDTVPLGMFLDEIGTYLIGRWEDFQAVARDAGVGITLSLQEQLQFDRIYGRDASKRLRRNCAHKVFMRGMDFRTAEDLSREIGNEWILDESRSDSSGRTSLGITRNAARQLKWVERPIRTADQITRMPKDMALVFGATDPFEVELVPYFQSPRLNAIVQNSIHWSMSKRDRNLRCDKEGINRPRLEVQRLRKPVTDWTPIVGEDVMKTGSPKGKRAASGVGGQTSDLLSIPMPKHERKIIEAKCKKLGIKNIDIECQNRFRKNFSEITKGESLRYISYLSELEQQFDAERVAAN